MALIKSIAFYLNQIFICHKISDGLIIRHIEFFVHLDLLKNKGYNLGLKEEKKEIKIMIYTAKRNGDFVIFDITDLTTTFDMVKLMTHLEKALCSDDTDIGLSFSCVLDQGDGNA